MESIKPPVDTERPTKYRPQPISRHENRLSSPFNVRLPAATTVGFLTGAALGISHGGKTAGMRFRAENAHRFPTTPTGWYLYHKSKNYNVMQGGIKEGLKMGFKLGLWTGSFFVIEEAVDGCRGTKDFLSTVVAGVTVAAAFSGQPWNLMPLNTAARTIRTGLYSSLAFGLAQDALGLATGRQVGYVDRLFGSSSDTPKIQEVKD